MANSLFKAYATLVQNIWKEDRIKKNSSNVKDTKSKATMVWSFQSKTVKNIFGSDKLKLEIGSIVYPR